MAGLQSAAELTGRTHSILDRVVRDTFGQPARIVRESNGKPMILGADRIVQLSLAHCPVGAVLLFSATREVGVDAEPLQRCLCDPRVTAVVHDDLERGWISATTPQDRCRRSRDLWVLKESVAKLSGAGLTFRERQFSLTDLARPSNPRCWVTVLSIAGLRVAIAVGPDAGHRTAKANFSNSDAKSAGDCA